MQDFSRSTGLTRSCAATCAYPRYVMQEDALLSTETPREAITFSARLRCGYSAEEARPLVDRILKSSGPTGPAPLRVSLYQLRRSRWARFSYRFAGNSFDL